MKFRAVFSRFFAKCTRRQVCVKREIKRETQITKTRFEQSKIRKTDPSSATYVPDKVVYCCDFSSTSLANFSVTYALPYPGSFTCVVVLLACRSFLSLLR